jgi:hypothetical protein
MLCEPFSRVHLQALPAQETTFVALGASMPCHGTLYRRTYVFPSPQVSHLWCLKDNTDKETYEPLIEHIFYSQSVEPRPALVGEVWTVDAPNHGEASILNEKELLRGDVEIS